MKIHKSYRYLIHLLLLTIGVWLFTGCGGGTASTPMSPVIEDGNTNQSGDPPESKPEVVVEESHETGALFKVNWPRDHQGQIIPAGTNRIIIFVSGRELIPPISIILNDVNQPETEVFVAIPPGEDRLVSAIARDVGTLPPGTPTIVYEPTREELLKGTMLASGATKAFNLLEEERKEVQITLAQPASMAEDDSYIISEGTQFDPGDFPVVVVYGAIVDQDGNSIKDLELSNFRVYEQTEGNLDFVEAVVTDVRMVEESGGLKSGSIVLCLDKSGSMYGTGFENLKLAAHQFVSFTHPTDQIEVVNFSSGVNVDQVFTTDKALVNQAIDRWYGNSTALYSAVFRSISDASEQPGRKAVLVMTDGKENNSTHTLEQVRNLALQAMVPVYTIGLGSVDTMRLTNLADATGGVAYFTPSSEELEQIYKDIAIKLGTQVRITYISPDPNDYDPDKLRDVKVYLTNYPPLTNNNDILGFETSYKY